MRADVLESEGWLRWGTLLAALALSALLHLAFAASAARIEPRAPEPPRWVEMTVAVVDPPEPEPEPKPEPEPEPPAPEPEPPPPEPQPIPPPEPEVVDYAPEPEPEPETPPPDPPEQAEPVRRITQGLSNSSFLEGGGTDLTVRAGTTTAARATSETLDLSEADAFASVPYVQVTEPPRARYTPALEIPQVVIDERIEGRVEVQLLIDAEGRVSEIEVVGSLHPEADAACIRTLKRSRWRAGRRDGTPVVVRGVPYSCRFQMTPG